MIKPKKRFFNGIFFAKPISGFRTSFEYNNILFFLAGEIIKAVTGISWEEFVKERIFKPLNMENSYTSITEYSKQSYYASSHEIIGGKVEVIPLRNIDNFGSAGSINSNIIDMAQWLKMQMNNGMYN
ncbi:MAG: serine hydrolase domain-containing protein [Melioribacteraceae bacterium]